MDVLNEMDMWRDTVVVFTADHGEMAGAHGGLKGKGPFSYEANAHVPLIMAHPAGKPAVQPLRSPAISTFTHLCRSDRAAGPADRSR